MQTRPIASSIKRISLIWAISLPACSILGTFIGHAVTTDPIGSSLGEMIGLTLGGAISGLGTAFELQVRYPKIKVAHIIIICAGWAVAMFIIAILEYAILSI